MKRFITVITILFFGFMTHLQAQQSYTKYCNARYGFCIQYPVDLGIAPAPTNNDGRRFYDDAGFSLSVYGSYNALSYSLREQMTEDKNNLDQVTYQVIKNGWYVVSGYKGADIIYKKTLMRGDIFYHLYIQYPARYKNDYNNIVSKVSKSFKAPKD
ncbi:MAG: hypothetical protein U9R27_12605 [Campylobacterota bacterium]|nr:hypothetical protein [Campylobacterota bacterium]